jgi:hypothetical protein
MPARLASRLTPKYLFLRDLGIFEATRPASASTYASAQNLLENVESHSIPPNSRNPSLLAKIHACAGIPALLAPQRRNSSPAH